MPNRAKAKPEKPPKGDPRPDQSSAANTLLNSPQMPDSPPMSVDTPESSDQSLGQDMNSPLRKRLKTGQYSEQLQMDFSAKGSRWSFNAPSTASVETPISSASAQLPNQDLTSTPFADSTVCVAVDVSSSTRGLIVSQEALVISIISRQLSQSAQGRGRVLPWSGVSHPILRLTDSAQFETSYGTDPSVLCSSPSFSTALRECSLWFLLTDGAIRKQDVKRFASGIAGNGFHGSACVILLFGYLPHKPIDMNISIGVSVFAMAPNCLFLFHDVESGKVYVVQCKGCYTMILPETWENPSLGRETNWNDLQEISYEQLARLHIPKPTRLDRDDLALPGGKIIKMRELYQDNLDPQSVKEIFDNDDSMKSVLLTSATQGHADKVEFWLKKQKSSSCDSFVMPRPDINGRALSYTQQLLDLMKTKHTEQAKMTLQNLLQKAHVENWNAFRESIDRCNQHSAQHNLIVGDSINRIASIRSDSRFSPAMLMPVSSRRRSRVENDYTSTGSDLLSSPTTLTPVSSRTRSRVENESSSYAITSTKSDSLFPPGIPIPVSSRPRSPVEYKDSSDEITSTANDSLSSPEILTPVSSRPRSRVENKESSCEYPKPPTKPRARHNKTKEPEYLYTPRYRRRTDGYSLREHRGDCALCGASKSPVALLLKNPNTNLQTEGLPPPGSRAKLAFPLAMGKFPETDIISWFVCCDPCSYFVTAVGDAPPNEKIVGAVILTNLEDNRKWWTSALVSALESRFADEDLELVFLAILYTALQNVMAANTGRTVSISNALLWAISQLEQNIDIPMTLSQSLVAPHTEVAFSNFYTVLENSFLEVSKPRASILQYPIEGFAILFLAIENMQKPETRHIHSAVFQRFLFHLTEQYQTFLFAEDRPVPVPMEDLLAPTAGVKDSSDGGIPIPDRTSSQSKPSSVPVSSLCGGPLLSKEALTTFRSMGSYFLQIEKSGAEEIATFLLQLLQTPQQVEEAVSRFDLIRTELDLQSMSQKSLTRAC